MFWKKWWVPILIVMASGILGSIWMSISTYDDAPPIPDFMASNGKLLIESSDILAGQAVFQKYSLMEYGSFFGDGAGRGPDYTTDALHRTAESMIEFYSKTGHSTDEARAITKREIKNNRYNSDKNEVILSEAQTEAWIHYRDQIKESFLAGGSESMKPGKYIEDEHELRSLASFFLWGGWVCGAARPEKTYSYTHNWPYEPVAGNTPSSSTMMWTFIGSLALFAGAGAVLYGHGKGRTALDRNDMPVVLTLEMIEKKNPDELQRAAYPMFMVSAVLLVLQVLAGILTIHDFVGFTTFFGVDISEFVPITITRSWHIQLGLFWITTAWIAASIFFMPKVTPDQPRHQLLLVRILSSLLILTVAGTCIGIFLGPKGLAGSFWREIGNQGWEYVELGRFWQTTLLGSLFLWSFILFRGYRPAIKRLGSRSLPFWLVFSVVWILILFTASFMLTPNKNFVISDYWRWVTVHMWVEAFFEVLTTVMVGFMLRFMGLVPTESSRRAAYLSIILFLGSGLLGIAHNFYWNAKPVAMLALGSVFSTLQTVPLLRLSVEAWRYRQIPRDAENKAREQGNMTACFGQYESYRFLIAVSFWNFTGAGLFGFIINLPIANYYEHGTYLTVNHGHAALMGVYGNMALAGIFFCCRFLIPDARWNARLLKTIFWSLNIGLALMIILNAMPAGILQLNEVLENGYWMARSQGFIKSPIFQTLTWMRIIGGAIFTLGGVFPAAWFIVSRKKSLKCVKKVNDAEAFSL